MGIEPHSPSSARSNNPWHHRKVMHSLVVAMPKTTMRVVALARLSIFYIAT
jgi:hypothetical protein